MSEDRPHERRRGVTRGYVVGLVAATVMVALALVVASWGILGMVLRREPVDTPGLGLAAAELILLPALAALALGLWLQTLVLLRGRRTPPWAHVIVLGGERTSSGASAACSRGCRSPIRGSVRSRSPSRSPGRSAPCSSGRCSLGASTRSAPCRSGRGRSAATRRDPTGGGPSRMGRIRDERTPNGSSGDPIEARVGAAVDAWLRWVPTWQPGTHRGRSRMCRRCTGSPCSRLPASRGRHRTRWRTH
ncbi:hypothetical protein [Leucobacter soli]|uniref:hypothetical protein n=1 Tax=Leucobacter soli TaxID=2812850 RepID=UPI00360699D2